MHDILQPWELLFAILSGWLHRRQQQIIEFQNTEIISLMQSQGKKRILLTDDQRRLLAVKGKSLLGLQNTTGTDNYCHSRHNPPLASTARSAEMGLQRS